MTDKVKYTIFYIILLCAPLIYWLTSHIFGRGIVYLAVFQAIYIVVLGYIARTVDSDGKKKSDM